MHTLLGRGFVQRVPWGRLHAYQSWVRTSGCHGGPEKNNDGLGATFIRHLAGLAPQLAKKRGKIFKSRRPCFLSPLVPPSSFPPSLLFLFGGVLGGLRPRVTSFLGGHLHYSSTFQLKLNCVGC
jgi:hypothetical protein